MSPSSAVLVIAICLAALAAVAVRIALSLRDIEKSVDRVAEALESLARRGSAGSRGSGPAAARPGGEPPTEAEIAAAIAAASRGSARRGPAGGAP